MHIAPYFTALGFLALFNAFRVIGLRRRHQVSLGDGGNAELLQAVRAFGNLMEYAPFGLVLLFALEYVGAPVWYLHLCGAMLVVGRLLHSYAFTRPNVSVRERVAGMLLTFGSILLSSVGVTLFSLMSTRP